MKFTEVKPSAPTPVNHMVESYGSWKMHRHFGFHFLAQGNWSVPSFEAAIKDVDVWCEANIKRRKLWLRDGIRVMIRTETDAFNFKMRWC